MVDPVERLVNLAIYLAATPVPVTAEQVRANVEGYSAEQETEAFLRMFERDKEDLRDAGLAIVAADDAYRIDPAASFAASVDLTPEETAALRAVGVAFLEDPAFPFTESLRLALAKLATAFDAPDLPVASHLADESPGRQSEMVAAINSAVVARKRVTFTYTNSYGERRLHEIEPYGLFVLDGRWYAVGRDTEKAETRVYTVARVEDLVANRAKPKSPDYELPADFEVGSFIGLPFQYGPAPFEATLRFAPSVSWRAEVLSAGIGSLEPDGEAVLWHVTARSPKRLAQWLIENGPGISAVGPPELLETIREGLIEVEAAHG